MVDSTNFLLEKHFKRMLWDKNVEILDPATGTGTFICSIIDKCPNQYLAHKYKNELHANDVAILPYYVANLNIEYTFKQKMGYFEEFPNICFVDTLDNVSALKGVRKDIGIQMGFEYLSSENTERIQRQNQKKISVVIGNPPYNANQKNENENNKNREYPAIDKHIKDSFVKYSTAQKTKVYDMYARFYRWAMDRLDENGVIAFITNRSFIDSRTFDGFRRCVEDDFTHCYIVDTKSDVRVNPKIAGTTHNVFGIQTGVALMFLVKSDKKKGPCKIEYTSLPDEWRKEEKWSWFRDNQFRKLEFERIRPDKKYNWLNIADNDFEDLTKLVDKNVKSGKSEKAIFKNHSLGIATNRDEWVYDLNQSNLENKIKFFIHSYKHESDKWHSSNKDGSISDFVNRKIKWTTELESYLLKKYSIVFDKGKIRAGIYRPFFKQFVYFDKVIVHRLYQQENFWGIDNNFENFIICVNTGNKNFNVLACNNIPNNHFNGDSQCLPFYSYNKEGEQLDNITDWGLQQFHNFYANQLPSSNEEGSGVEQTRKPFNQNTPTYIPYKTGTDKIHNNPRLKKFRKELRHNLTPAEASLWKMLQGRKLEGRKFRRQHSVGNYILDFYCPEERLGVELDGDHHFNPSGEQYDEIRTNYITNAGIRIIRFENKDVFEQTEYVLESIKKEFGKKTTPGPSLQKEGSFGITKEDIFHYVYAVLHNPAYRKKYELNLRREFPRIPFYEDFWQWAAWGKQLMELHINYETVEPYPLEEHNHTVKAEAKRQKEMFAMLEEPKPMFGKQAKVKPKLKADKQAGIIEIDELTFLRGVPREAWDYKLGNRSALEWVLDQYKEKKPKDTTIAEKFNTYRFADYKEHVIELLKRVCTVSVETVRIVGEMEKVKEGKI
ncbi:MAG: DUF559 domain-containing protein [Bacteroidales bacterium]|nr:DUF559 domain-containing protein [Bacteroidales bacterium]